MTLIVTKGIEQNLVRMKITSCSQCVCACDSEKKRSKRSSHGFISMSLATGSWRLGNVCEARVKGHLTRIQTVSRLQIPQSLREHLHDCGKCVGRFLCVELAHVCVCVWVLVCNKYSKKMAESQKHTVYCRNEQERQRESVAERVKDLCNVV